tara:strand:+ start:3736 stop:4167 length:432 start_codon:yes stop_codon:yes gene_type:complete
MEKKNFSNEQEIKRSNLDQRKKRNLAKTSQELDKKLPWWVELLFVQIGLPDKWLIKILKTKKKFLEIYKDEKKLIFYILLFGFTLIYFQPVTKYSKTKLKCQRTATKYILETKKIDEKDISKVKMIASNFCNGGNEINNLDKN